jgi:Mat/Ecp fimbriae major subunit
MGANHGHLTIMSVLRDQTIMTKFMTRAAMGAALAAAALTAGTAHAQDSATATASANILQSITVTNSQSLDFGTIVPGGAASTVVVTPGTNLVAATRTCGVGLTCSGGFSRAVFDVTGTHAALVDVTGDSSVVIQNAGGDTMNVALVYNSTSLLLTRLTPASTPTGAFYVGGTLSVAANQAAGAYSEVFNVTVEYN